MFFWNTEHLASIFSSMYYSYCNFHLLIGYIFSLNTFKGVATNVLYVQKANISDLFFNVGIIFIR